MGVRCHGTFSALATLWCPCLCVPLSLPSLPLPLPNVYSPRGNYIRLLVVRHTHLG